MNATTAAVLGAVKAFRAAGRLFTVPDVAGALDLPHETVWRALVRLHADGHVRVADFVDPAPVKLIQAEQEERSRA